MKSINLWAGKKAYKKIKDSGLTPDDVKVVAGAAGGPKWLVLANLDRALFGHWFKDRKKPLFTIGALVAGAIWAQKSWSVWWNWDPKETSSLVVFLIAAAYLHARHVAGWRGRRSAILAALIFVAAVFTLFANLIFGGLHSYSG